MAVPDTNSFTLQDVVDEVNPTTDDLVDCFNDADPAKFDATYEGSKDRLSNFRNYGAAPNSLSISPNSQGVGDSAGSFNLTITTNAAWSYSDDAIWLAPSSSSGVGNAVITISYSANGNVLSRTGTITITTTDGSPTLDDDCVVEQAGSGGGGA